jgi:glucose-1-phosphate cytidylyltransferase
VILAGGKGMRMREYTETAPKALAPIGPYPVILHVMKIFAAFGYKRFILCLGYKLEAIKEYFMHHEWVSQDFTLKMGSTRTKEVMNQTSSFLDFEITFADTGPDTATGGRIKKIEKYVKTNNFFVVYCDGLSDINISELMKFHKEKGKIGTVAAVHFMSPFGIIDIDEKGNAISFKEKPVLPGFINGGFLVFRKDFFDYLDIDSVLEEEPLRRLVSEGQLAAYRHEGFWACMDTFKDWERLNILWERGYMPHVSFRGKPPWVR